MLQTIKLKCRSKSVWCNDPHHHPFAEILFRLVKVLIRTPKFLCRTKKMPTQSKHEQHPPFLMSAAITEFFDSHWKWPTLLFRTELSNCRKQSWMIKIPKLPLARELPWKRRISKLPFPRYPIPHGKSGGFPLPNPNQFLFSSNLLTPICSLL